MKKANPKKRATGTVIEAKLDKGRGPVATLLVQNALNGTQDLWADLLRPLLIVLVYTVAVFVAAILVFRSRMKAK